jgi:CrcB protein
MWAYLAVAAGGALGSVARFWVSTAVAARWGAAFPYGTLLINLTGSFLVGCFLTLAAERLSLPPVYRLWVATGFLGGYTTFSAFEYETLRLVEAGAVGRALGYVASSVLVGFLACWGGVVFARELPIASKALVGEQTASTRAASATPEHDRR